MTLPQVVSRSEWLEARRRLLDIEKAATKARDAVNAQRRELPMVALDKAYVFDGPDGAVPLAELFDGRCQLVVYHFMFDPSWDVGCTSCSFLVDNIGHLAHLRSRETSLAVISRAPIDKISAFKARMDWTFPWVSSFGNDFNYDFHVTNDPDVAPVQYNYRDADELATTTPWHAQGEQHGLSVFLRDGEQIYHTYSTYGRGPELVIGTYNYLDLTPLGRQEDGTGIHLFPHHDTYSD
ncbi:MAG: DUF899 domain-containing protein [Jatrophihabitantaceae bacterium]